MQIDPINYATNYRNALNKLLEACGYGDTQARLLDRKEIDRLRPGTGAAAAVVCEIGGLDLHGIEVNFDGFHFSLKEYGFHEDTRPGWQKIRIEPINSYMVGFWEG